MKTLLKPFEISKLRFQVGIADSEEEIDAVYKLRFDIFNIELNEGIKENEKIQKDIDEYDKYCDHLIIKDKDLIVATYRIHPSWKMNKNLGFYSETEFNIDKLCLKEKRVIEVGRACIHKEYRSNVLLVLLWAALKNYCEDNKVAALFGVASIAKCTVEEISSLYHHFKNNKQLIDNGDVFPLPDLKVDLKPFDEKYYRKELRGSLLKGYVKMGAKLYGEPVFDKIFGCYDFFVYLDMNYVNWEYIKVITNMIKKIDEV